MKPLLLVPGSIWSDWLGGPVHAHGVQDVRAQHHHHDLHREPVDLDHAQDVHAVHGEFAPVVAAVPIQMASQIQPPNYVRQTNKYAVLISG